MTKNISKCNSKNKNKSINNNKAINATTITNINIVIQMTTRKVKVLIVFKIKEIIKMKKSQRHFLKQMKKN